MKSERQRKRERYTHLNAEFERIGRRDKKLFLSEQCKEIEENNTIQLISHANKVMPKILQARLQRYMN